MVHKTTVEETNIDYIIIGQGLAGSWLGHELIKRGYTIRIYNKESENTSTLKAGGLYNPVTGKKLVKTWKADVLFPNLEKDYRKLETLLGERFVHPNRIYRPFASIDTKNDWEGKMADPAYRHFVHEIYDSSAGMPSISDPLGGIVLNYSGYIHLQTFVHGMRAYFKEKECYTNEYLDPSLLETHNDTVSYKGLTCRKVIFCDGPLSKNSYWADLPYRPVRGETIDAKLELKTDLIVNQGVFMIPKAGYFTIGATYFHDVLAFEPQQAGINELLQKLQKIYTGNVEIINQRAGVRPATYDRKPFIGENPKHKTLGIFNGFGAKGVSLVPYFTSHFVDFLEKKGGLDKDVNVERVY